MGCENLKKKTPIGTHTQQSHLRPLLTTLCPRDTHAQNGPNLLLLPPYVLCSQSSPIRCAHLRDSLSNRTRFLPPSYTRLIATLSAPPPPSPPLPFLPNDGFRGSLTGGGGPAAATVPLLAVPDAPLPPRPPVSLFSSLPAPASWNFLPSLHPWGFATRFVV
jgi:hypothetical protein